MTDSILELSVSEFVDLMNQTLEFAYPSVTIVGELSGFRISKNKWLYFDLKDNASSVHFFGSVSCLPGPLEDGMVLKVIATPRLHHQYGFNLVVQEIKLSGEGTIKRALKLLEEKLTKEGLFDQARKRAIPYPPNKIGLIASSESAAYSDFIKIINQRWVGMIIYLADVKVQGDSSAQEIIQAINHFNQDYAFLDAIVLTRGGGSLEDLQVFNEEQLVRAIAGSRLPTIVAIGHERDFSLAEAAADQRASTPSNAAELLTPDKKHIFESTNNIASSLERHVSRKIDALAQSLDLSKNDLDNLVDNKLSKLVDAVETKRTILKLLDPVAPLNKGFSIVRRVNNSIIRHVNELNKGDIAKIEFSDGVASAVVDAIVRK